MIVFIHQASKHKKTRQQLFFLSSFIRWGGGGGGEVFNRCSNFLLLLILCIVSDDFVLLNTWNGICALFANALCDILIFHTSSIQNFECNHMTQAMICVWGGAISVTNQWQTGGVFSKPVTLQL